MENNPSQPATTQAQPTITMRDFFALPEVQAQQAIQKRTRYGSVEHRAAYEAMRTLAATFGASAYFGNY